MRESNTLELRNTRYIIAIGGRALDDSTLWELARKPLQTAQKIESPNINPVERSGIRI